VIDDQAYNRFARALAETIRARAKGIDDDSARIVNTRPQEHVLSGFLTPHDVPAAAPHADDTEADVEIDDLPKDSAFELTALGLEFMADRAPLAAHTALSVTLQLNVYVRVVPTWSEQNQFGTWQRDRAAGQAPATKSQALVPAWRRFQIAPFDVAVTVADLLRIKRQRIDVSPQVRLSATESADPSLYSARHAMYATEAELATEVAFSPATVRAHPHAFASSWSASVDVRLINVPTEPNQVRLAVRVINETVAPGRAQVDFVDPNLYGVRISVAVPGTVHRPTVFQELPASFRYERMMPGVGINAHVESPPRGVSEQLGKFMESTRRRR